MFITSSGSAATRHNNYSRFKRQLKSENISVWKLFNHGAVWLVCFRRLRNNLTYLHLICCCRQIVRIPVRSVNVPYRLRVRSSNWLFTSVNSRRRSWRGHPPPLMICYMFLTSSSTCNLARTWMRYVLIVMFGSWSRTFVWLDGEEGGKIR